MSWEKLFEYCYNSSGEAKIRVNEYIIHPAKLDTIDRVKLYDDSAVRAIERMETYIDQLKSYRQSLADRYAALASMPYTYRLELKRYKGWSDKRVTYTLRLIRVYEDGHEEDEEKTTYAGTERREALKEYEAMKKARPGISCLLDLEKRSWGK